MGIPLLAAHRAWSPEATILMRASLDRLTISDRGL
jgi:hypothetical protein